MSSPDREDFGNDLLAARERDLKPLLKESQGLGLDLAQTEILEDFLNLAWFSGIRSGQAQMNERATHSEADVRAIAIRHFEADFEGLMEQSADMLNLSLSATITMWSLLHQAWLAGNRTCKAELLGLYLETQTDVTEEVRRWLEEEEDDSNSPL